MNQLLSINAIQELIKGGARLSLAGEEACLDQLPAGHWIAGTIPYFMDLDGGVKTKDRIFVTHLPDEAEVAFTHYATPRLAQLVADAPDNGFALAIIPALSPAHARYAQDCRDYEGAFLKPTVGWIAGVDLDLLGQQKPKVYNGSTGEKFEDGAVVAHVALPAPRLASIEIVNIFEPDGHDVIRFPKAGFTARECTVNGETTQLAAYLARRGLSAGALPLVGDFAGAHANVSFQKIDLESGDVAFYAPVFQDVEYWMAKPIADYADTLRAKIVAMEASPVVFSCNCILNFLYGGLEGQKLGQLLGPITFGEIADQLLNQTFVALRID